MQDEDGGEMDGLRAREARLESEVAENEARVRASREALRRVRRALALLTDAGDGGGGAAVETLAEAEVVAFLEAELMREGELAEAEIRSRVAAQCTAAGKNGRGLHLRVGKALKDPRFVEKAGSYRLARAS